MATPKRIYKVTDGECSHLVKANNQAQAIHYVTSNTFKANVATQEELVELVGAGVPVEEAGKGDDNVAD